MNTRPVNTSTVLVRALLAYSVHEHEVGTAKCVQLKLQPRSCIVEDDGRGIGFDHDGYVAGMLEQLTPRRIRVALHGIGLAIVLMSTPMLTIESRRGGRLYHQTFSWGTAQGEVQSEPAGTETGTRVSVTLASDAPEIEIDEVLAQVEVWRAAHAGLRIEVTRDEAHAL